MIWLFLIIILGIVGWFVYSYISTYNELVQRRNKVKNAWGHVEAQIQRRFDLVPNLVAIVKGAAAHERQIFDSINAVVNKFMVAETHKEKLAMDAALANQLKTLMSVMNNYPQMQSNKNFLQLQNALTEIEEDISYARQFYNDAVTIYNNKLMAFPGNMIAEKKGFQEEELFDATTDSVPAPNIFFVSPKQCPICNASVDGNHPVCPYCGCDLT